MNCKGCGLDHASYSLSPADRCSMVRARASALKDKIDAESPVLPIVEPKPARQERLQSIKTESVGGSPHIKVALISPQLALTNCSKYKDQAKRKAYKASWLLNDRAKRRQHASV